VTALRIIFARLAAVAVGTQIFIGIASLGGIGVELYIAQLALAFFVARFIYRRIRDCLDPRSSRSQPAPDALR